MIRLCTYADYTFPGQGNQVSYNNNFRTTRQNIPYVGKAHATVFLVQRFVSKNE